MEKKNLDPGEVRLLPTPPLMADDVHKCGLRIFSFYENVTSRGAVDPRCYRTFAFCCITQLVDGDGFWCDPAQNSGVTELRTGDWILVAPGDPHSYGCRVDHFTEDSLAFDGPVARTLLRSGLFRSGIVRVGRERRLLPVIRALRNATLSSQLEAHALLLTLVLELCEAGVELGGDHVRRINRLLAELQQSSRSWSVAEMAEYCNWSENYFRRLFQSQTGMSPKEYLDQRWFHRAIELLASGSLPIAVVARQLEFDDVFYFSRRFRELAGMTPTEYRRRYRYREVRNESDPSI